MDIHTSSVNVGDSGYPFLLQNIFDPPKTLYYKGVLPDSKQILLAVVGSRKMTEYGKSVLQKILPPIIRAGVGIVSGLAYGIDAESHVITLEHGGNAYGVIGGGIDDKTFYPQQNLTLSKRIIVNGGALISEYQDGSPALPRNFAIRNRIVAGMCHGVLIIEAAKKSGSLITAEVAMNENREVFAIPNTILHRGSDGTNELLKQGAHLVTESNDILSRFNINPTTEIEKNLSLKEIDLLQIISKNPMHIDVIAKTLSLTVMEASARLSELEIQGVIKNIGGMNYIKNNV